jgi:hypothetical protein
VNNRTLAGDVAQFWNKKIVPLGGQFFLLLTDNPALLRFYGFLHHQRFNKPNPIEGNNPTIITP